MDEICADIEYLERTDQQIMYSKVSDLFRKKKYNKNIPIKKTDGSTGSPPVTSPPLYILLFLHHFFFVSHVHVTYCKAQVQSTCIENKVNFFFQG